MDFNLFQIINNLAGESAILDWFGIFCAKYLIFIIGLAASVILFFYKKEKDWRVPLLSIFKILLSALLGYLLKIIINLVQIRPRPFVAHDVHLLVNRLTDGSFPSMHTLISFVIAFSMYRYNKKIGVYFLVAAALVSFSRVYVGVHYPSDILGGVLLALVAVFIVERIYWDKIILKK